MRNAFIPPTALRLMKGAGVSLPAGTLRTVMSGGESLGADTLAWARESLGVTVAEIYGQTEANYLVGNSPGGVGGATRLDGARRIRATTSP